jgi:D-alanine-D-alanine ligase
MVARRRTESKVKVLVLHNTTRSGADHPTGTTPVEATALYPEADVAHLRGLADGLCEGGFDVALVDAEDDTQRITHAVVVEQPALVFLVDHFHGDVLRHPNVASLLELHGLPYTGSDPLCLSTCRDRVRSYLLLSDAEIPVPAHAVVRDINAIPDTDSLGAPLLVSHALDDLVDEPDLRVLARTRADVEERAQSLAATVGLPLLVEQLIEGRRIQAVVLGNRVLEVLPLVERVTDAAGQLGAAQIAQLDVDAADSIRALAQRAFRVMGCRDCAQVDFALDRDGRPHVINVHPLFDMFPDSAFVVGAGASELGFPGAVAHLAEIALERAEPEPVPFTAPEPPPPEPEPAAPEPPAAESRRPRAPTPRPPTPRRRPASRTRPRTGSPAPPPPKKKPPQPRKRKTTKTKK